jgi:uncharacterized protein
MSSSEQSPVFMFDGDDPGMLDANKKARATFRYFWRELAWERRRIVPGLDMACVKAPFSDGPAARADGKPAVEQMWINDVDFDGKVVRGTLINSPNWLKSVKEGDAVTLPGGRIADWMYAIAGRVYGGFTVNLMRARMNPAERKAHDRAWGLNFGDPAKIHIVPPKEKPGFFARLKGEPEPEDPRGEHPMSENMAPALREELKKSPEMLTTKDDGGWTILHHQALAGSVATVKVLLEMGADTGVRTAHGMTALDLARVLGWKEIVALLSSPSA